MKLLITNVFFLVAMLFTNSAFAQEGLWTGQAPGSIETLQVHVFDLKQVGGVCNDVTCFRMDVYINGEWVARWITSPGRPDHANYPGVYTPEWDSKLFNLDRIYYDYVNAHGDPMPYAMFLGSTGVAIHQSGVVNGRRESHGCLRLKGPNARQLNTWMREAKANGAAPTLTTEHTRP